MTGSQRPSGGSAAATLRAAVGLLTVQATVVALIVAFLVYKDFTARAASLRDAMIVTGFAALIAVLLGVLALALARRRAWARGPAVVMELMLLPIGWYMVSGGLAWLGVPVFALGLLGAGLLIAPATREALGVQ
ncbi:hypothetical protein [Planosporangium mesophilum]|uniref:hypothetical protein n=1 Tax=Planosporangium mesophilum TaxID=689768 RepID=UPI00143A29B6|nr:hypothetical protein [Planosporangium mesophilum]NJC81307.1 hypothetical protein [Planosporangium mesophilum]